MTLLGSWIFFGSAGQVVCSPEAKVIAIIIYPGWSLVLQSEAAGLLSLSSVLHERQHVYQDKSSLN